MSIRERATLKTELIRLTIIKYCFYVIILYFVVNQNTAELGKIKLNTFIQTS